MLDSDREEVAKFIEQHWHSPLVMSHGRSFYPHKEQGLIERRDGKMVGLLTYHIDGDSMEMLSLNSILEGRGIGSSLILAAIDIAREQKCKRVWLATTNDNLRAVGFYQRLGFRMVELNLGAIDEARKTKPQIPLIGDRGVEIHDEFVMELELEPYLPQERA